MMEISMDKLYTNAQFNNRYFKINFQDTGDELIYKEAKAIDVTEEGEGDYWAHRIDILKKEHQSINKIIEAEYERTVENTNKTYEPPKITNDKLQKIKPCLDWRAKVNVILLMCNQ